MTEEFAAEQVLCSLKDFQRRTAEWVFRRMFDESEPSLRFLVADEVGLGKTHVAKGVIAQVIEHLERSGDERHDIVYVCSNGAIARQNLRKLVPPGVEPLESVERLTMLPLVQLDRGDSDGHDVNLLAITPGTSLAFGRNTGRFQERVLAYTFLREHWGANAFSARARWIFWAGVSPETGDQRLRDKAKQYKPKILGQLDAFADAIADIDRIRRAHRQPPLRELFDNLVQDLAWKRTIPDELVSSRRELIGEVRRAMATVGIAMLQPDLVVLDEFQRFKDLLNPNREDWAADLANRLFTHADPKTGRPTRTLLLSATPYRMYTTADEPDADHYADFLATCSFLFRDTARVAQLERRFADLRLALTNPSNLVTADDLCSAIKADLRAVMVRTERLAATPNRDGMLRESDVVVTVEPIDLRAYLRLGDLAAAVESDEPSEYWKSSPYLFNFMEKYKLKQGLERAVDEGWLPASEDLQPGPGLLDWEQIRRYEQLDPQNGRLRWLLKDLEAHDAFDLLWVPASLRYYDAGTLYEGEPATTFTKRLLFSGWTVVPKVVSTLVSYEAERRAYFGQRSHTYTTDYSARGGRRLDYRLENRRPGAMTAFLFVWPSPTLAELGDPRPTTGGGRPSIEHLLGEVRTRISRLLIPLTREAPDAGVGDERWYWAAPLLLDKSHFPRAIDEWFGLNNSETNWTGGEPATGFVRHAAEAWALIEGQLEPLGRVPDDLVDVLAEVAVGAPAICALRALAAATGLEPDCSAALTAAARTAWSFRSYFSAPDVTAVVLSRQQVDDIGDREGRARYWRDVIRHAIGGNLQAVLDEHAHVVRDWLGYLTFDSEDQRADAATAIAERIAEALELHTSSFRVDIPRRKNGTPLLEERRLRSRLAVAFGNQQLEEGGEARVDSVSAAFNSPFWPFVLTSTSVGQEGLDFHLWCHAVVHWNLPSNPVDLEQREGRVHRYKGHAIRRNIAATFGHESLVTDMGDIWDALFARAAEHPSADGSEMVPYWVFHEGPAHIERYVPVHPFSREAAALPRLRKSLAVYRLAFGQPRQEELVEFLGDNLTGDEVTSLVSRLRIDLSPPDY